MEYDDFHYSVPHELYKQLVTIRATATAIEILNENRERVALHPRCYTESRYVTNIHHMPPHHRHQHRINCLDGAGYREWAKTIGERTYAAIDYLLASQVIEEQAFRSCLGILRCAEKYGQDKVSLAQKDRPTPLHENLRGSAAYM